MILEQFPFPIQRIQTDRGLEFFAEKVQLKMMKLGIKFRPNKPASPHLNGKVERSQKTDLEEFYAITDLYFTPYALSHFIIGDAFKFGANKRF